MLVGHPQEHSEITQRALRWIAHGKRSTASLLLQGDDIQKWSIWKEQALKYKQEPEPSPLLIEFIKASRRYSTTRRRMLTASAVVMTLLIMVGAVCSGVMAVIAAGHASRADQKSVEASVAQMLAEDQRAIAEEQKLNAEREAAKALLESERSKLLSRRTAASSLLSVIGTHISGSWANEDVKLMNVVLSNFTGEQMEATEAAAASKLLDMTKLQFISRGVRQPPSPCVSPTPSLHAALVSWVMWYL